MTCYHPLIRHELWEKYRTLDGHWTYKAKISGLQPGQSYEDAEEIAKSIQASGRYRRVQIIPCGKCIGCRLEYSKQWATKGILEAEQFKDNWFLTITYDQEHLPENGSLKANEFKNFIKKIREYYDRKYNHIGVRFMGCGEYGTLGRPHYHAIMFNMPIPIEQMKFHEYNENHEALYRCPELEKIWGKGMIVAAEVNWNTCAYVARYITKKVGIPANKEHYKKLGIEPEFFRMSRKPGIGREYYEKNKNKLFEKDEIIVNKYGGGQMKVKPPKYYEKLYDIENPEKIKEVKEKRKKEQERISKIKYHQTTKYKKDQLLLEEDIKKGQAKSLIRTKV